MDAQNKYNGLDLFKFIMSFFVVAIHTFPWTQFDGRIINFFDLLTQTAVPFFFLASGYLLACKFTEAYSDESNIKTVIKRLKQIIKMYLLWTLIYLPLGIYSYIENDYSIPYSIIVTLRKIVFRGENFNSWMLWYLLSTIYALVFILITMKLKFKPVYLIFSSCVMLCLNEFINYIAWSEQTFSMPLELIKTIIKYTITDGRLLGGLFYLPLGIYLCSNMKITKYLQFLALPGLVVTAFIENSLVNTISDIFMCLGVFCFALRLNLNDNEVYKILRKTSTTVYLIHMYVYSAFCFIVYHEIKANMTSFVFTVLATAFISVAWTLLKSRGQSKIQN